MKYRNTDIGYFIKNCLIKYFKHSDTNWNYTVAYQYISGLKLIYVTDDYINLDLLHVNTSSVKLAVEDLDLTLLTFFNSKIYINNKEFKYLSSEEFKEERFALSTVLNKKELRNLEISTYISQYLHEHDIQNKIIIDVDVFIMYYLRLKQDDLL